MDVFRRGHRDKAAPPWAARSGAAAGGRRRPVSEMATVGLHAVTVTTLPVGHSVTAATDRLRVTNRPIQMELS